MRRLRLLLLVAALSCRGGASPPAAAETSLEATVAAALAQPERVAAWQLSAAELAAVATPGFAGLHDDYVAAFARRAPALMAHLRELGRATVPAALAVEPQYAEARELSAEQSRLRWALPVGRPGAVVLANGVPLETIFVRTAGGWRALLGLDDAARARVLPRALEVAGCEALATRTWSEACREGPCLDALWQLADRALRGDDVTAACALLATMR